MGIGCDKNFFKLVRQSHYLEKNDTNASFLIKTYRSGGTEDRDNVPPIWLNNEFFDGTNDNCR